MKIMEPIPELDPKFDMTLDQVIEARCRELLQQHHRLHLLWSGGIDTTAMLIGFFKVAAPQDWQARLSVHYCPRSVRENPRFFYQYISKLPQHGKIEGHVRDFVDGSKVVVGGDPADMLFGTYVMANCFTGAVVEGTGERNPFYFGLEKPWTQIVPEILRQRKLLAAGAREERDWLAWISPQVGKAPIPIVDLFDWLWWMTYSCKFQHDLMRVYYNRERITPELMASVENFYLSPAWHQWSFHNHDIKMQDKRVWASYKWPLKQYIVDFDGDTEYFAAKIKVKSVSNSFGYQLGFDDELNIISFGVTSSSLLQLERKYGTRLERFLDTSSGIVTADNQDP